MEDLPTKHGGINRMVIRPGCKHFFWLFVSYLFLARKKLGMMVIT
jgi:hypothetical protein